MPNKGEAGLASFQTACPQGNMVQRWIVTLLHASLTAFAAYQLYANYTVLMKAAELQACNRRQWTDFVHARLISIGAGKSDFADVRPIAIYRTPEMVKMLFVPFTIKAHFPQFLYVKLDFHEFEGIQGELDNFIKQQRLLFNVEWGIFFALFGYRFIPTFTQWMVGLIFCKGQATASPNANDEDEENAQRKHRTARLAEGFLLSVFAGICFHNIALWYDVQISFWTSSCLIIAVSIVHGELRRKRGPASNTSLSSVEKTPSS